MNLTVDQSDLSAVWQAINRPAVASCRPHEAARIVKAVAARGWAAPIEHVDDLLCAQGCATPGAKQALRIFGVSTEAVFRRPEGRATMTGGVDEIRAADLAKLLITMERTGFPVDPVPLVDALLPEIQRQTMLTSAELHCLWFARERHRLEPVVMVTDLPWRRRIISTTTHAVTLPTGYRAELWSAPADAAGNREPISIVVTKPKRCKARVAA